MSEPNLKRIAPFFSIVAVIFFAYGFFLIMIETRVFESMMFIAAYLLFMYASVTMDDDWEIVRKELF